MYDKQYFIEEFKRLGFQPTDTVFVHSSYKKIAGEEGIEGGGDTVIDAFLEYFGKEGLVVFPAMSWMLGYLVNERGELRDPSLGEAEGFFEYGNHFYSCVTRSLSSASLAWFQRSVVPTR